MRSITSVFSILIKAGCSKRGGRTNEQRGSRHAFLPRDHPRLETEGEGGYLHLLQLHVKWLERGWLIGQRGSVGTYVVYIVDQMVRGRACHGAVSMRKDEKGVQTRQD